MTVSIKFDEKENQEFQATIADQRGTQKVLKAALDALGEFYGKKEALMQQEQLREMGGRLDVDPDVTTYSAGNSTCENGLLFPRTCSPRPEWEGENMLSGTAARPAGVCNFGTHHAWEEDNIFSGIPRTCSPPPLLIGVAPVAYLRLASW